MNAPGFDVPAVHLTARSWATIDATMDNVGHTAIFTMRPDDEAAVEAIRQAGWDQVPWIDGAWPPMDQILMIRLSADLWQFAIRHVRRALEAPVDDESEALERAALAEVEPQLR